MRKLVPPLPGARRNRHAARAFSLVEIIVAAGIIAVLAALLFPSLNAARESSRTAACSSNLSQIGKACFAYATDNDGMLPAAKPAKADATVSWVNSTCMYLLNPYLGNYRTPAKFDIEQKLAFDGVFRCPAKKDWNLNASSDQKKVSYAMNTFDPASNLGKTATKLVAIPSPVKTVLFAEVNMGNWAIASSDPMYGSFPALRHAKRDNILFCDGHVEAVAKNSFQWELVLP